MNTASRAARVNSRKSAAPNPIGLCRGKNDRKTSKMNTGNVIVPESPIRSYAIDDQRRMTRARNYFAWQARLVKPHVGPRVVEAGCGIGNFTGLLLDRELVVAADEDAQCVELVRARYPEPANLRTVVCDVTSPRFRELASFRPDSCVCLNVLEHIRDDRAALENMAHVVAPGGTIVLIVPAFQALYGPIDRKLGHLRRYRKGNLLRLAHDCGLSVKELRYFNLAGFFGWWMNAHLLRRDAQSEMQIAIFDACLAPVMSRVEAAIAPPFGQSLFAVL